MTPPVPTPSVPWSQLEQEARERFGVEQLRPGQREIIEAVNVTPEQLENPERLELLKRAPPSPSPSLSSTCTRRPPPPVCQTFVR